MGFVFRVKFCRCRAVGERIFGPSPHGRAAEGRSVWNRHPLARRTRISQRPRVRPSATSYSPCRCRPGQPPERRQEIRYNLADPIVHSPGLSSTNLPCSAKL